MPAGRETGEREKPLYGRENGLVEGEVIGRLLTGLARVDLEPAQDHDA